MAWIECHDTLSDHPKVIDLAGYLRLDRDAVVGKLIRLWTWAINNRVSGVIRPQDKDVLVDVMRYKGRSERLIDALLDAKLLDELDDGALYIHNWDIYAKRYMDQREEVKQRKREQARERKRQQRERERIARNVTCDNCVTLRDVTPPTVPNLTEIDLDSTTTVQDSARARGDIHSLSTTIKNNARQILQQASLENPTEREINALGQWLYLLPVDMVASACSRAQIYGPQSVAAYASEILRRWYMDGARDMSQISDDGEVMPGGMDGKSV